MLLLSYLLLPQTTTVLYCTISALEQQTEGFDFDGYDYYRSSRVVPNTAVLCCCFV